MKGLNNEKNEGILLKNKIFTTQRGITLITLIITIIVLLILASITISALSGDNGILSNAARAKRETEIAEIIEQIRLKIYGEMADNMGEGPTEADVERIAGEYGVVTGSTFEDKILTTTDGEYEIKLSDIWTPEKTETGGETTIPEGLEIGSYVSYNPSGTYVWDSEYCSSPEDTSYEKTLDSSTGKPFNIDTWRVFDIDDKTGKVTLVPEHSTDDGNDGASATSGTVYLKGAQGYNNGVKLLNDACSALYGDKEKEITARSINIVDIEGKMTVEALAEAHNYSGAAKYGEQVPNAYTQGNSYYPSIYAKELYRSLDGGDKITSGLGMSEQTNLIKPTDDGATNGRLPGTSLRPTQTYWSEDNSFMQTAFETANRGVNYYDLLMSDGSNTFYWVASRCVDTNSGNCSFGMSAVYGGEMNNDDYIFYSNDYNYGSAYYGLFPVVSLSSELIEGDSSTGFAVQ